MDLIEILKHEEGFSGSPYIDTEGFETIGFGSKLPIDTEEAEMLLIKRLDKFKLEVQHSLSQLYIEPEAWDILYAMAYQLGTGGLLKFKKMISALEKQNYVEASRQMLDSRWAKQTPNRATRMAQLMEEIK